MSEKINEQQARSKSGLRLTLMVLVPVIALVVGVVIYLNGGRYVETDNAYVKADMVAISPEVAGVITEVSISENQQVEAGALLFAIDPRPYEVALARASAELARVKMDIAAQKAAYKEKQAELALAERRLRYAESEFQRQQGLEKKQYLSRAQFDEAEQARDVAKLNIAAIKEDLNRLEQALGGSVTLPVEQHPNYLAAVAEVNARELDLSRTRVVAPQNGTIRIPPKKGQYLAPGNQAMTMVADNQLWIEANFTETSLTYVQPGQDVEVSIDTYPDVRWHGTVESLSPATSAEFSLIPAQNATGNWVKIAQRVPVRIRLKDTPDTPPLRAGLSAITQIDTGHARSLMGVTL